MKLVATLVIFAGAVSAAQADDLDKLPPQPTIPPDIAARLAEPGRLVAAVSMDGPDGFRISRLTRKGPVEVFREPAARVKALHWLDAKTRVVLDGPDEQPRVRWFVDGKLDAARTIEVRSADWALPTGAPPELPSPVLGVAPGGGVWLSECLDAASDDGETRPCKRAAYLRVDARPLTTAKKKPKGLVVAAGQIGAPDGAPAFPRLKKPPAGVAVKLQKVTFVDPDEGPTTRKGFTCTAGSQTASWPAPVVSDWRFDVRPDKVVWVSATPALFYVEGKATDPIGRTARERRYFRACEPAAMREVRWLGDGLWAEMKWIVKGDDVVGAAWIVHLDAQPIAVVAGERFEVAPS